MGKILIIDDDAELCDMLTRYLQREGMVVESVQHGRQGLEQARSGEYELIVLDVMLPGMNGFDVLRELRSSSDRASSNVPVLLLTARGEEVDRIVGLEIGADDYLPKPFNPRELLARLRAITRRNARESSDKNSNKKHQPLTVGDLRLDPSSRMVLLQGKSVSVTALEFNLLEVLLRAAGNIVSRDDLATAVLGRKLSPFDRTIDVHISRLRKKIGTLAKDEERIKTIRNTGYMYVDLDSTAAGK